MNQVKMYKCIIESPDGSIFVGRGTDMFKAYTDAISNFQLSTVPKVGRGMWEVDSKGDLNKNRKTPTDKG